MKYISSKHYLMMNDFTLDKATRDSAEAKLQESFKLYNDYMQKNIGIFSKSFLNVYNNSGFHDFQIKKIEFDFENFENKKKILNIIIHLENNNKMYYLIHKDVTSYSASIDDLYYCFLDYYVVGEYYKDDNCLWHHNFLFGSFYEFNITCKKFILRKNICY